MNRYLLTIVCLALLLPTAHAGHLGLGSGGADFGGFGFRGGRQGGFHGGDGFGLLGLGAFDTDWLQTRFENKFDDLMTDYDTGLAEIEDFYNSEEYTDVVDGMELLVDRYDLFLGGVERSIERQDDIVLIATDDLTYYTDLLAEYEARDDLSEVRLDRIVKRLTNIQDLLMEKIDVLTEKQTTLSENLGTYQSFDEGLTTYLADILAAGGETDSVDTATEVIAATSVLAAMAEDADDSDCETALSLATTSEEAFASDESAVSGASPQTAVAAAAVAEPGSGLLVAIAASLLAMWRSPPKPALI